MVVFVVVVVVVVVVIDHNDYEQIDGQWPSKNHETTFRTHLFDAIESLHHARAGSENNVKTIPLTHLYRSLNW